MHAQYESWETRRLTADVARHEGRLVELATEVNLDDLSRRLIQRAQRHQQPSGRERALAIRCVERLIELETFEGGEQFRGMVFLLRENLLGHKAAVITEGHGSLRT